MRLPFHSLSASLLFGERRLIHFNHAEEQGQAAEIVAGHEEIAKHPDWKKLLAMYDDPMFLRAHRELTDPVERGYFRTILLQFSVPQDVDVATANPEDIARLPHGIVDPALLEPGKEAELGEALKEFLPDSQQKELASDLDSAAMGTEYVRRLHRQPLTMERGGTSDGAILESTLSYYKHCRATLDELLQEHGILIPETQSVDLGLGNNLQREDYVVLLAKVWNGGIDDLKRLIESQSDHPTVALKQYIHDSVAADGDDVLLRTHRLYAEQSLEQLGPTETLRRLGVMLGADTYMAYQQGRSLGADAIPSASTWMARPDHALAFLDGKLPNFAQAKLLPSDGNERFLDALRWYVAELGGSADAPADLPSGMNVADVKAMIGLVSTSLLERENANDEVQRGTQKMIVSRGLNVDTAIEKGGMNLWKFMWDFKKHPLASGVLFAAAAGSIAVLWNILTAPRRGWTKFGALLAAGGLGYGLYQQHTKGEAWWNDAIQSFDKWWSGERGKQPEEQTLPAHWVEKLHLDDHWLTSNFPWSKKNHAEAVIASLSEQQIAPTLHWFGDMYAWEKRPDGSMPPMPSLPSKHRRMFGEMPSKERSLLYFGVLKEFFRDRGAYVREHHMDGMYKNAAIDDVALGFEYMRDKYDRGLIYEVIATQFKEQFQVVLDGDPPARIDAQGLNLNETDILNRPDVLALRSSKPAAYAMLEKFLAEFRPVRVERDTGTWTMASVFFAEADPEILRRIGRDGARAASNLDVLQNSAGNALSGAADGVSFYRGQMGEFWDERKEEAKGFWQRLFE